MRAILTYHSIDGSGSPISVSAAELRRHVSWLASGRVRVVPLDQLVAITDDDEDAIALTFDDAFANFAELGAPLLRAYGLPATLFVVSDQVGGTNQWGGAEEPGIPNLSLLDWEQLATLAEQGFFIGAHTRRHAHLPRLSGAALEDEILGAVHVIGERLGVRATTFAYPYGETSSTAAAIVRRTFDLGVTTELRSLGDDEDRALLPRLDMYYFRAPGRLEQWGSSAFRRRLWIRAQARRVREAVSTTRATMS